MGLDFLKIGIIADDKTGKGVKSAEKNMKSIGEKSDDLAKKFAAAFAADKIIAFGKAAVEAFLEDQKQATRLAKVVDNLGLSFANPQITQFIDKLTLASGVADDKLRPAFQSLITTTGSLTHSQELLKNAIDISRGSGEELTTVAQDLANAYVGNTKGLKKYNLGLTQAELKTASFEEIMTKLNKNFNGSSAAFLSTYAGKMEVLNTAAGEAKETIGKGLVDAIALLTSGTGDVNTLADAFQNLSDTIGTAFVGVSASLDSVKKDSFWGKLANLSEWLVNHSINLKTVFGFFSKEGKQYQSAQLAPSTANSHLTELMGPANEAAQKAAEELARKRALELAKAQEKQTKAIKEQALLKKQGTIFDMQQIQLVAALKGKLSEEEKDRVLLQLALLQGNEEAAAKLSAKIADSIDKTGQLKVLINSVEATSNPFKQWQDALNGILDTMNKIADKAKNPLPDTPNPPVGPPSPNSPDGTFDYGGHKIGDLVPFPVTPIHPYYGNTAGSFMNTEGYNAGHAPVQVYIDGKAVATAMQNQSLSGNNTTVDRLSGNFNFL